MYDSQPPGAIQLQIGRRPARCCLSPTTLRHCSADATQCGAESSASLRSTSEAAALCPVPGSRRAAWSAARPRRRDAGRPEGRGCCPNAGRREPMPWLCRPDGGRLHDAASGAPWQRAEGARTDLEGAVPQGWVYSGREGRLPRGKSGADPIRRAGSVLWADTGRSGDGSRGADKHELATHQQPRWANGACTLCAGRPGLGLVQNESRHGRLTSSGARNPASYNALEANDMQRPRGLLKDVRRHTGHSWHDLCF